MRLRPFALRLPAVGYTFLPHKGICFPMPRQTAPLSPPVPPSPSALLTQDSLASIGGHLSGFGVPRHVGDTAPASCWVDLVAGDASDVLESLPAASVDCVVTSPPYYGLRDYGVEGQIGLEAHPDVYLAKLVDVFRGVHRVLKGSGSVWVNIGDTYWSGKGLPTGKDPKRGHKRFRRPQDRRIDDVWCRPKQLLLLPHRFAIEMQKAGWIVRNDIVWHKTTGVPDPARDRSAVEHEYIFHFVKQRRYHFDMKSVEVPSNGKRSHKPPPSVWEYAPSGSQKKHSAVFPEWLLERPMRATLPNGGVLLDPFCGSGTSLTAALRYSQPAHLIGVDLAEGSLAEAQEYISRAAVIGDGASRDGTDVVLADTNRPEEIRIGEKA